jgi:GNAT superfamily N-acetyltransferase
MRGFYIDEPSRAMLSCYPDPDGAAGLWELSSLRVPAVSRGQGLAGRLLGQAIADADAAGLTLTLRIHPDPWPDALDYDALRSFYSRRGFDLVDDPRDLPGFPRTFMVRLPR